MTMFFVYILECSDKSYYIGVTRNLKRRIIKHREARSFSTKYRLPIKLKWVGIFPTEEKAVKFEKYLKTGSGKSFMKNRLL